MKNIYLLLLLIGIVIRFIFQFIFPTFNVDEISLGNNIKYSGFLELLYPLKYLQSSPPLYLWMQKMTIEITPFRFWINIKILSFISSICGLLLFYNLIRKNNYNLILLLPFIILLFNPFNITNSLTVKQYTIDLTGILFLLVYFKSKWFDKYNWFFFLIWCLMSNIGLFACAGYLMYDFINQRSNLNIITIFNYLKKNSLTILAPLPYIIYFIWFMKQTGATELKVYMTNYWSSSFIPLDSSIFKYLLYTVHGLWIFIFNAFEIWGIFMMLLMIPFFIFLNNKNFFLKEEILILTYVFAVHLIMNVVQMYPFSDRLYLYTTPLFILLLGSSLSSVSNLKTIKTHFQKIYFIISIITVFLYSLYSPISDNDVCGLYKKVTDLDVKTIYVTEKSKDCLNAFDKFTDYKFKTKIKFISIDTKLEKSNFIVSRVHKKIKMNKTSEEELVIQNLVRNRKIEKIDNINGYNIYCLRK